MKTAPSSSASARHWRRFTLIELLVVVAIIGVLASLLFPALNTARAYANAARCTSNLKQLSGAIFLYAGENEDYLPPLCPADGNENDGWWYHYLYAPDPDNFKKVGSNYMSNDVAGKVLNDSPPAAAYRASGAVKGKPVSLSPRKVAYGMNGIGTGGGVAGSAAWRLRVGAVSSTSNTILLADTATSVDYENTNSSFGKTDLCAVIWRSFQLQFRHPGQRANLACVDGHVEKQPMAISNAGDKGPLFFGPLWTTGAIQVTP